LWESLIARSPKIIEPHFKVGEYVHVPPKRNILNSLIDGDPRANTTSSNWSGAVQTPPPAGQTFCFVSAKWIVPAAYPPQSAKTATGWTPGTYWEYSWVGLDGYFNSPPVVFQTGTASVVTVNDDGVISSTEYFGWHEWYPAGPVIYQGFPVNPGDLVSAFVLGNAGDNKGDVCLTNITQNVSTGLIQLTAPPGVVILGIDAEWITEDPSGTFFPNYGAEFFFDCIAQSHSPDGSKVTTFNLSGATLVNAVQGSVTVSTAVEENPESLLTYAYNDGP